VNQYTAKEVENFLTEGTTSQVIDVREVDEVNKGMIPGAIHIPLRLLEFKLHELDKSKSYIIVCRSGARSGKATEFLNNYGYNATNMTGGMLAWEGNVE
jgi:rhodanese-related sulfurtransferase